MRLGGRRVWSLFVAVLFVLPVAGVEAAFSRETAGAAVTNHGLDAEPQDIVAGPDGALWFTSFGSNPIGRITTAGVVTTYTDPSMNSPMGITVGPDGALWFTNFGSNSIGRITTSGVVTNYSDPSIDFPEGISAGSDGALWFANAGNDSIGRITTSGAITNFTDEDDAIRGPMGITAGPDGALWFTDGSNSLGVSAIGRITTSGVATSFTAAGITNPRDITAGPDGALWFTNVDAGNNAIGRISTSGVVTSYTNPTITGPTDITVGPDGALWFTNVDVGNYAIGRITTSGVVTSYADADVITDPNDIVAGSDGALWFTNQAPNSIGRITTDTAPTAGDCGTSCVRVIVRPGVQVASKSGRPTDAFPTIQVLTLPKLAGARSVTVTFRSINPSSRLAASDKLLCPTTGNKCSGQISVFAGNFSKYVNKVHPIQIQVLAKWKSKVGPGKLLMSEDSGGPPIQLAVCRAKAGRFNTPCLKSEVVKGSAAKHNLVTTSTVLFVGTDPRFARHVANGPDAPVAVKATAGKGKATVQWQPPAVTNGRILTYAITPHLGKTTLKAVQVAGTSLKKVIEGLKTGKSYTFTITAKTAAGTSLSSKASHAVKVT